jgi:putative transposase
MPRRPRYYTPNLVYHVLNRGARRAALFDNSEEYAAFEHVLVEAMKRVPMRLLAYCAMRTHWHLVLWPETVTQMPRFMHWMTTTHAQRWHARRKTAGTGPVYQGRYKAVGVHSERRVLRVCRYVERNPVSAGLVSRAEEWRWSSLWRRCNSCDAGFLGAWPVPIPTDWVDRVNSACWNDE